MNRRILYRSIKVILLLNLSLGVTACFTPPEELEKEKLEKFNQRYVPEYQIIDRVLYVDWKPNSTINGQPLKLRVPMNYLKRGIDQNGRLGMILNDIGPFGFYQPKDSNKKPEINGFEFEITESGQPVILNKDGSPSNKEDIYDFTLLKREFNGRPEVHRLTNDRGGRKENIFRAKDINGLENYKRLSCYDTEEFKENIRVKGRGHELEQVVLDRLANKAADDLSPKNCLSNELDQFWISPPEVPDEESVGIFCGTTANCVIGFTYKSRRIAIITHKNRLSVIPKWQAYRQQVIQTIQQFETQ